MTESTALCSRCRKVMDEKKCSQCRKWKKLSEYGKNKAHKDGLGNWCRSCVLEYYKEIKNVKG